MSARLVRGQGRARAQASIELALLVPIGLAMIFAVLGVARVTTSALSLSAVVRESARAGAEGSSAEDAWERARSRGQVVAAEDGLRASKLDLEVDTTSFGPAGQVRATARYTVSLVDVPFLGAGQIQLSRSHVEPVGAYRAVAP